MAYFTNLIFYVDNTLTDRLWTCMMMAEDADVDIGYLGDEETDDLDDEETNYLEDEDTDDLDDEDTDDLDNSSEDEDGAEVG